MLIFRTWIILAALNNLHPRRRYVKKKRKKKKEEEEVCNGKRETGTVDTCALK